MKFDDILRILISSKLKAKFHAKAVRNGTTMSDVIREFIKDYIK